MTQPLEVIPVEGKADLTEFIRVPWALYLDDPQWVPPLLSERRDLLDAAKNPFFGHAEVKFWLARRGTLPVGRISAQVNHAHLAVHQDATGHFGMFEADDAEETFRALLTVARDWLRAQGMRRVVGPFSLSINDESGVLVDGFDRPPSLMMGHAPPYYGPRIEEQGFIKAKDLICYRYDLSAEPPPTIQTFVRKAADMKGLVIRPLDMRRYHEELAAIIEIFNDAWSENWGFIPLTDTEIRHMAKSLRPLVRPDSFAIAELEGTPVAMAIGLPNLNEAIADLNGRLLPFGWMKLLWRVRVRTTRTGRLPLMGVRKQYHATPLGAVLALAVIEALRVAQGKAGMEEGELSWILEDNLPMRRMIEQYGGVAYKTYRLYERNLG